SVNTPVSGVLTNLRMQKAVSGALEKDQPGQYLLTVTNLGPDTTTVPFNIVDIQPPGVVFTGTDADGIAWECSTLTPVLNCTYNGSLAVNDSAVLVLDVDVTGNGGLSVTNTAQVLV